MKKKPKLFTKKAIREYLAEDAVHVIYHSRGKKHWAVLRRNNKRATRIFVNRQDAIRFARKICDNVTVHNKNGEPDN